MQREIDQRKPGVVRQGKAQWGLYARWYYLDFNTRLRWYRHGTAEQTQYPRFDLANVVKYDGRCVAQSLARQNTPYCISVTGRIQLMSIVFKSSMNLFVLFENYKTLYRIGNIRTHLLVCREAPTFCGEKLSLHASMIFFRTKRHSRNIEKNGWCEIMHSEVKEWLRTLCENIAKLLLTNYNTFM